MRRVEEYLQRNKNATLLVYVDEKLHFVARLYDNDRGNHIASGYGTTLHEAFEQLATKAEKEEPCKSSAQAK
jgi:hypothetical protein